LLDPVVVVVVVAAASYTLFFKECFDHKYDTELNRGRSASDVHTDLVKLREQSVHERMKNRPPAALPPTAPTATGLYSSTSDRCAVAYFVTHSKCSILLIICDKHA